MFHKFNTRNTFCILIYAKYLFNFQFLYESEKTIQEEDILKDIEKGVRLKHVKTNDRSKPNLRGKILFSNW
jgi:hypothetical protein